MTALRFTYIVTFLLLFVGIASAQTYVNRAGAFTNGGGKASGGNYVVKGVLGQGIVGSEVLTSPGVYKLTPGINAAVSSSDPLAPDLVFTGSDINPATLEPGDSITITFTIKNTGFVAVNSAIKVKAYLSTNTEFEANLDIPLEPEISLGSSLAVNGTITFPLGNEKNRIGIPENTVEKSYQVLLVIDPQNTIEEKSKLNNIVSKGLTVQTETGSVDDTQGPLFGSLTLPDFLSDQSSISVLVTDEISGVDHVDFYHKPAASTDAFTKEDVADGGATASIALNTQWADEIGIEGYFVAYDKKNNSRKSNEFFVYNPVPSDKALPNLSFGGKLEDYSIFSIPYDLDDNSIDEVFKTLGTYDKTSWRIVRYQAGRNVDKSEGLTKIDRGQAFWFNSVEKADVKIGSGTTVDKDQSPDFTMTLEKGYNQIGDPFIFDLSWSDILAANPAKAAQLSQQILVYNKANISLDASDNLKAWSGGFVLADDAMTISIPASLNNGSGRIGRSVINNSNPDLDEWMIPIRVQQDGVINSLGGIGMHPEASISKDIYDIITPPKFMKYAGISSEHMEFFQPMFSRDVVKTVSSYNWTFNMESTINNSNAELVWDNDGLQSSAAELLLYDADQRMLIDMKTTDRYVFDPQHSRSFRFFFGADRSSVKPDIQDLGIAWPNPSSDVVHVPFLVKERSHIQIAIYDLMGRKVIDVVDGERDPGYHTATWDRTAADGSFVAPGIYLYRMNGSATVARIIVN